MALCITTDLLIVSLSNVEHNTKYKTKSSWDSQISSSHFAMKKTKRRYSLYLICWSFLYMYSAWKRKQRKQRDIFHTKVVNWYHYVINQTICEHFRLSESKEKWLGNLKVIHQWKIVWNFIKNRRTFYVSLMATMYQRHVLFGSYGFLNKFVLHIGTLHRWIYGTSY